MHIQSDAIVSRNLYGTTIFADVMRVHLSKNRAQHPRHKWRRHFCSRLESVSNAQPFGLYGERTEQSPSNIRKLGYRRVLSESGASLP